MRQRQWCEVLKVIWDVILANCNDNEQAARVNADRFVIFWIEAAKRQLLIRIEKLINEIEGISEQLSVPRLYPVIGIRAVEKLDDADKRYGEALRAKALVKNRRDRHYAFYDEIDYDTIVENKKHGRMVLRKHLQIRNLKCGISLNLTHIQVK